MKKFIMIYVCALLLGLSVFSPKASAASIKLTMKQKKYSLSVGMSQKISINVTGTKLSKVKWKSSSSSIVSVNQSGMVKGLKPGSAKVTAYLPNTKYSAVTTISIKKKVLNSQEVFEKVNPSIVYIELFDKNNKSIKSGSGVITKSNGTIVTNYHVITDIVEPSYVMVTLNDGRNFKTNQVIGYDEDRDLAVIKLNGVKNLPVVTLGNVDNVRTGEKAYALGSPLGISNSITEGIVSNNYVVIDSLSYIQSTAPISHGNSGGALVNQYGEVIGINIASLVDSQNMNLAIPINEYTEMNLSTIPETMVEVNRNTYFALFGEGDVFEEEPNDEIEDGMLLEYKINHIRGSFSNNEDIDVYGFLLNEEATIKIQAVTDNSNLDSHYSFVLLDSQGFPVIVGDFINDPTTGRLIPKAETQIPPGLYILVFITDSEYIQPIAHSGYNATVEFVTK